MSATTAAQSAVLQVDRHQRKPHNRPGAWPDQEPLSVRALSDGLAARAWRPGQWQNGANPPWEADFAGGA